MSVGDELVEEPACLSPGCGGLHGIRCSAVMQGLGRRSDAVIATRAAAQYSGTVTPPKIKGKRNLMLYECKNFALEHGG